MSEGEKSAAMQKKAAGNESYKKGNYVAAAQLYSEAIALDPIAEYYGNRSAAHLMCKNYQDALKDSIKAIELDPSMIKAYIRASKCALALGESNQALSILSAPQVAKDADIRAEAERVRGLTARLARCRDALSTAGRADAAANTLSSLVESDFMQSFDARTLLCEAWIAAKKFDKATEVASDLMRSHGSAPEALRLRALCLYHSDNVPMAIRHLQKALELDPDHSQCSKLLKMLKKLEAAKQRGNDAFKAGRHQEAYDAYTEAISLDGVSDDFLSKLYCNRAAALSGLKRWKEVITDCTSAIGLKEDYGKAYSRRAQAYSELEEFQEAVRDLEKLKELEPDNDDVRPKLRQAKLDLKKSLRKDYYKILGVDKDADDAQIKKGYRTMALKWHPDKNSDTEENRLQAEKMFKDVGEAWACLSDPQKKQRYDAGVDEDGMGGDDDMGFGGGGFGGGGMGGIDPSVLFSMFMGGGGMGGMGGMGGGMGGGFRQARGRGF